MNTVNYSNGFERRPDQTRILLHFITTKIEKKTLRKTAECGGWRTEVQTCVAQWMNGTRSYVRKIVIM